MFENLMQVEHPNIVKFHKYWLDMKESQARVRVSFFLSSNPLWFFFFPLSHTLINSSPPPPASHRSYSSQNTCPRAASSSFWRKLRRTTRPWMWRSVFVSTVIGLLTPYDLWWWHWVLQSNHCSGPYFQQDYRLCNRTPWWRSLLRHLSHSLSLLSSVFYIFSFSNRKP